MSIETGNSQNDFYNNPILPSNGPPSKSSNFSIVVYNSNDPCFASSQVIHEISGRVLTSGNSPSDQDNWVPMEITQDIIRGENTTHSTCIGGVVLLPLEDSCYSTNLDDSASPPSNTESTLANELKNLQTSDLRIALIEKSWGNLAEGSRHIPPNVPEILAILMDLNDSSTLAYLCKQPRILLLLEPDFFHQVLGKMAAAHKFRVLDSMSTKHLLQFGLYNDFKARLSRKVNTKSLVQQLIIARNCHAPKEILDFILSKIDPFSLLFEDLDRPSIRALVELNFFKGGHISTILNSPDTKLKSTLIKYAYDLDQEVRSYVEKHQLFDQVEVAKSPYGQTAQKVDSTMISQLENCKGATEVLSKKGNRIFIVLDPTSLPPEWNFVGKAYHPASGANTHFFLTPVVKVDPDGNISLSQRGIKAVNTQKETKKLKSIVTLVSAASPENVEKSGIIGGHITSKYYKNGDAGNLPPLDNSNPQDQINRLDILIGGCKGALQLKKLGLYQIDFKLQNIFYRSRVDGSIKHSVIGDLGGLFYLPTPSWNRNEFNKVHSTRLICTFRSQNYHILAKDLESLASKDPTPEQYTKMQALAEEEICYDIWVSATLLFKGTNNPEMKKCLDALFKQKTIEGSIALLEGMLVK